MDEQAQSAPPGNLTRKAFLAAICGLPFVRNACEGRDLALIRQLHYRFQDNLPAMKAFGFCEPANQNLIRKALGLPPSSSWPA